MSIFSRKLNQSQPPSEPDATDPAGQNARVELAILAHIACAGLLLCISLAFSWELNSRICIAALLAGLVGWVFCREGHHRAGLLVCASAAVFLCSVAAYYHSGLHSLALLFVPTVVVAVGLMLDTRLIVVFSAASATTVLAMVILRHGINQAPAHVGGILVFAAALGVAATASHLLARQIRATLRKLVDSDDLNRQALYAMARAEREIRTVADNLSDSIFAIDLDRNLVYANPAFERLTGCSANVCDPADFLCWVHPLDRDKVARLWERALRGERFSDLEYRMLTPNGVVRWVVSSAGPMMGRDGHQIGVQASERDITEQKLAYEELSRQANFDQMLAKFLLGLVTGQGCEPSDATLEALCGFLGVVTLRIERHRRFDWRSTRTDDVSAGEIVELRLSESDDGDPGKMTVRLATGAAPMSDRDRARTRLVGGAIAGILERKSELDRLAAAEERSRLIAENSGDVIWVLDVRANRFSYVSPAVKRVRQLEPEAVLARPAHESFAPNSWRRLQQHTLSALAEFQAGNESAKVFAVYDVQELDAEGAVVNTDIVLTILSYDSTGVTELLGVSRDVTAIRKAEEQLRVSEQRWELALAGSNDGIWDWDAKTDTVYYSDRWKQILDYEPGELADETSTFSALVHPEDLARVQATLKDHLKGKTEFYVAEYRMRAKDGSWRWILARGRALRGPDGGPLRMCGSHTDLTERHEAEQQLREAKLQAETSIRSTSAFLSSMSHEVFTPLNTILSTVGLLRDYPDEASRHAYLDNVRDSAAALLKLLRNVFDYSRLEAGEFELDRKSFSIADVLSDAVAMYSGAAREKGIALVVSAAPAIDRVLGDPQRLEQILENLIENALKFTSSGRIAVTALALPAEGKKAPVRFTVRDTGVGIDPDKLELIFDPFCQADQSATRPVGGAGLGLAISQRLVEAMGGRMWAESTDDGAAFHFELPFSDVAPVTKHAGNRLRILLVEDNQVNRAVVATLLRRAGHQVTVAANGAEAVGCAESPFDVVLMDLHMPVMDGIEAARRIREIDARLGRHTQIWALTASVSGSDRRLCAKAGMDGFMSKPINAGALREFLKTLSTDQG